MLAVALNLENAYKEYTKMTPMGQIIANIFSQTRSNGIKNMGFIGEDGKSRYFISMNDQRIGRITQDGKIYDKSGKLLNTWPPK
jgi:hypothetical protein